MRRQVLWYLIWVCTVCLCLTKGTLALYGLSIHQPPLVSLANVLSKEVVLLLLILHILLLSPMIVQVLCFARLIIQSFVYFLNLAIILLMKKEMVQAFRLGCVREIYFSYFSFKKYVVGTPKNCLTERVLFSTKNTYSNWWIRK